MPIPEGSEVSPNVKVLSPKKGIHVQKVNPIIQDLDYLYKDESKNSTVIWISNLQMPTNDYITYMRNDIANHLERETEDIAQKSV